MLSVLVVNMRSIEIKCRRHLYSCSSDEKGSGAWPFFLKSTTISTSSLLLAISPTTAVLSANFTTGSLGYLAKQSYEERLQQGTEDTSLRDTGVETLCTLTYCCGLWVVKFRTQLQRDVVSPNSCSLMTTVSGMIVFCQCEEGSQQKGSVCFCVVKTMVEQEKK